MSEHGILFLVLVLTLGGLGVVVISRLVHLPSIVGFAILGALIGPYGYQVLSDDEHVAEIAEIGMMALMFSIGLKFNLERLRALRRHVVVLGGLQVGACTAVGMAILWSIGLGWEESLIFSSAISLSSTAVVSNLLLARGEFGSHHGNRSISALLFQDLAVVLLLILIPFLVEFGAGDNTKEIAYDLALLGAEITALFVVMLYFGPMVMPMWMRFIVRWGSNEIFVVNLLAILFGFSWITEAFGFSLALGAFIAGILLAETPQKYLVEEIISPFREIFLGFFFITLGTLTDFRQVLGNISWVLFAVGAILVVKTAVVYLVSWLESREDMPHNLRVAVALGATGEFSFVLMASSVSHLDSEWFNILLPSSLIAMAFTPIVWPHLDRYLERRQERAIRDPDDDDDDDAEGGEAKRHHVAIFGFGRTGRKIAEVFGFEQVGYVGIESNPAAVAAARLDREPVHLELELNDPEKVAKFGLDRADVALITYIDPDRVVQTIRLLREHNERVLIVTKAATREDAKMFKEEGATEAIVEAMEGGVLIAGLALGMIGVHPSRVQRLTAEVGEVTGLLAGGFERKKIDWVDNPTEAPRVLAVNIVERAACIGKNIVEAVPTDREVDVISLRRGENTIPVGELPVLQANDVVLLLGKPGDLFAVERLLLSGAPRRPSGGFWRGKKGAAA